MTESQATAIFRRKCSLCDETMLDSCLKLPDTPLANEFTKNREDAITLERYPLELLMCADCRHVQTSVIVLPEVLFKNYVYATSTSPITLAHLNKQAKIILKLFPGMPKVMEVGSNDGALGKELAKLGHPSELYVGVEPSLTMAEAAREAGVNTINKFFSWELTKEMVFGQTAFEGMPSESYVWEKTLRPDVIVANNVFAHVPSVERMLASVKLLLDENGMFIMDVAWAADIFVDSAFDTIYHEHTSYHALGPLMKAFDKIGMEVIDVDVMPEQIGRGSLRVFAANKGRRFVEGSKISTVLNEEKRLGLHVLSSWKTVRTNISAVGERLRNRLDEFQQQGKSIMGYGAPAKLTTLLYACRVDPTGITAIADDSPWKQGLYTPGMGIPVVSSSQLLEAKPEAVVVFAWNFYDAIVEKLRAAGYKGTVYSACTDLTTYLEGR